MITIDPPSSLSISSLSVSGLTRFLNRARSAVDLAGEVEVLLTDDAALRRLNRGFRGKNKSTDVLSFSAPEEIAQSHAGDLAISLETAARQAAEYGHSLRDEVRVLLLHGLLHLSGEDHETDDGEMAAREVLLRRELRLPITLIERVSGKPAKETKATKQAAKRVSKPLKKVSETVGKDRRKSRKVSTGQRGESKRRGTS